MDESALAPTSRSPVLDRWAQWIARREIVLAVGAIGIFFLLNLSIASRSPFGGGMDEVFYADPGLNLAAGKGWRSTAWFLQSDREFWAQNSPLYPGAISVWARIFGVSMVSVRAYGYFLGAAGTFFFWLAAYRFKLAAPLGRLFWIVLLSAEYATNWMMRDGRYDVWIFLGLGLASLGASMGRPWVRYGLIFAGCFLGPLAGFVCVPYIFSMAAFIAVLTGLSRWKEALTAMIGTGCGMLAVFGFYFLVGELGVFVHTLRAVSAMQVKLSAVEKLGIFLYPKHDAGLLFMLAALLLLTLAGGRSQDRATRRWRWFGWGTVILVPCLMLVRAGFTLMYFYMVVVPLSLSIFSLLSRYQPAHRSRWPVSALVAMLMGAACLTGLPGRFYTAVREWDFRAPRHMQDFLFVRGQITPEDRVLTDAPFYYVLRDRVRFCAESHYIGGIPLDEATNINVLVLPVSRFPDLTRDFSGLANIGGGWKKVAVFPTEEMLSDLKRAPQVAESYVLYHR